MGATLINADGWADRLDEGNRHFLWLCVTQKLEHVSSVMMIPNTCCTYSIGMKLVHCCLSLTVQLIWLFLH